MKRIPDPRSAVLFTCPISIHVLATPSCYEPTNMRLHLCSNLGVIVGSCGEVSQCVGALARKSSTTAAATKKILAVMVVTLMMRIANQTLHTH
jgi:hypothetical protein